MTNYEKVRECPICNGSSFENKFIVKDHTVSKESFGISACQNCGFHFTNPRPTEQEITTFYQSDEYISHTDGKSSITDIAYRWVKKRAIRNKEKLIRSLNQGKEGKLLDIGSGTGNFLIHCLRQNWQVTGVEPSEQARKLADRKTDQNIFYSQLSEVPEDKKKFNIITLWHVLEHIYDLNNLIVALKDKLKKKGYLLIAVPNRNSLDAKIYQEHWAAWDVPRHLWHFSQQDIESLCKKHELKVNKKLPMPWDAYYISLMSEKYKNQKNNYLKSIINGYKSNTYANKSTEYSSIIYVIKKK